MFAGRKHGPQCDAPTMLLRIGQGGDVSTFDTPSGGLPSRPASAEEISRFVVEAAVWAPSVHNTQPWWFGAADRELSVHADAERRLTVADPAGREMLISCGAAVLTARVALRYLGLVPRAQLLPDPDLPNLVARISWTDEVPPAEYERELFAEIPRRRTHRGGFDAAPLPEALLSVFREEAAKESTELRIVSGEAQFACLAALVEAGDYALRLDSARAHEDAKWSRPPGSKRRDGVPATAYPATAEKTEPQFASRDFAHGQGWGLPPEAHGPLPRSAGAAAIITTASDRPQDWISAGQALQRVLLCASSSGVAAALHSQPLEISQFRDFIRTHLCAGAYPQMVLRLGTTSQSEVSVRRPVEDVLL